MKKTSDYIKQCYIDNVTNILVKWNKGREIALIGKQTDLTKKYKKAQLFVRENTPLFSDEDLYNVNNHRLEKNENGLYDNDIVGETDEKFISEIQMHDKSINGRKDYLSKEEDNILKLMKLFFGETTFKLKKDFIDKLDIDKVLVGYKNGNEVYYSKEFNSLYEIV